MKSLSTFLIESIRHLSSSTSGIVVFDIDDTLLRADASSIKIWKSINGDKRNEVALSTAEFAQDPDARDVSKRAWFDYREFRDENKVRDSILRGTPIINNLKIMDAYINAGYDFCFLTARGLEDVVAQTLNDFLRVRRPTGNLERLGNVFKRTLSHAVNDEARHYPGATDAEKKANVLQDLCADYDFVVFVDDDDKNVAYTKSLNLPNLTVIKAHK